MHKRYWHALTEESVIFVSIFKWVLLSAIIGGMVGTATAIFLKLLHVALDTTHQFSYYYLLLPFALFLSAIIIRFISPDSEGHGTEKVIWAVHKRAGFLRLRVVPVKLFTTILTIAFGGSAGKEGPCAQIGAALASTFSNIFRFTPNERKKLVICGISAGFASVLGTPVAGAIFGVEVLFVGTLVYDILLPSFVAGMVSFEVSRRLGVEYDYLPMNLTETFNLPMFFKLIAAGIFFGLVAVLFIEMLKFFEKTAKGIPLWGPFKGIIGGALLICIGLFFSTDYLGMGLEQTYEAVRGGNILWYAFILKIIATCITLSFCGSGGILTPLFFVGATSGVMFANVFSLNPNLFAAFGFVALLAGAANTPLAACILAVEMFGPSIAPFATIVCVISFLMTGFRSLYPTQVLAASKSSSILIQTGQDVESTEAHFEYKTRKRLALSRQTFRRFTKQFLHKSDD
jgi:H+/Cl- antiporter ClcA